MMRLAASASGVTIVAVDVLSGWVCLKQGKLPGWQTVSVSIPGKAPSTSLRVSSEGGEWGNNAAIYSANPAFFVSPTQTDGVLNRYSIAFNMLNIHWHFNLVYYGELENLMSDTLTQGNVLAHRNSVYLPLSLQCLMY